VILSVSVLAADTDDRAHRLIRPSQVKYLERTKKRRIRYPTPEAAADHLMTADEERAVADKYATVLVGSAGTVRDRLAGLQRDTEADELMLTTETHDPADRLRSYELVMSGGRTPAHGSAG
jgi:alkanesulfonate monooxygenase SsuD/methylene tetrahydromethanopterin reductase-like flavin-dependent oxidoreductase (luciferase family)